MEQQQPQPSPPPAGAPSLLDRAASAVSRHSRLVVALLVVLVIAVLGFYAYRRGWLARIPGLSGVGAAAAPPEESDEDAEIDDLIANINGSQ